MQRTWFFLFAFCSVAACGGGGGGAPATIPAPSPAPTGGGGSGTATAETETLLSTYADPVSFTTLATLPTSGSGTYNGYAYGDLADTSDGITDTLIGEMEMVVTFTTTSATVTGQIDSFEDEDGDPLTGSLALSGGNLDRNGNPNSDSTFSATVSGSLVDDAARTLAIGGQLEGDFIGTGNAAIGGEFLGTVTVGAASQEINGGFIAEQ